MFPCTNNTGADRRLKVYRLGAEDRRGYNSPILASEVYIRKDAVRRFESLISSLLIDLQTGLYTYSIRSELQTNT